MVCFLNLPKPMWIYVVGHELTHALWTWLFGGRVKAFRATSKGGHVVISKSNFLITLSPYFFPLYALLWMGGFWIGNTLWDWSRLLPLLHVGLGAAYAFHLTLTWHVLQVRQPDLVTEGIFFSLVIIWLGNCLVMIAALTALSRDPSWSTAGVWFATDQLWVYGRIFGLLTSPVR